MFYLQNYRIFPAEILHQFDRHEDYNIRRLNGDIMQFFKDTLFSEFQESTSISFKKYHKAIEYVIVSLSVNWSYRILIIFLFFQTIYQNHGYVRKSI